MDVANASVLVSLRRVLLDPAVLVAAVDRAAARLRQPEVAREPLQRELDILNAEVRRLTAAVAAGGDLDSLVAALRERETRRRALVTELDGLRDAATSVPSSAEIVEQLWGRLEEWRDVLDGQPEGANRLLRQLIVGRLTLYPEVAEEMSYYRFEGTGTVEPVLAGILTTEQRLPLGTPPTVSGRPSAP
jgi:hypothetical protein